jgi:hypothetical protein
MKREINVRIFSGETEAVEFLTMMKIEFTSQFIMSNQFHGRSLKISPKDKKQTDLVNKYFRL